MGFLPGARSLGPRILPATVGQPTNLTQDTTYSNSSIDYSDFPDWSNLDLSEDRSGGVIACAVITVLIASLFVSARFYTRTKISPVLGKEDWVVLASLIFSFGNSACMIAQCHYALGRHALAITSPSAFTHFGQVGWLTLVFYALSLWFTKVSILLLYIRILTYQWAGIVSKVMLALVTLFHLYVVVMVLTACVPIQRFWNIFIDGYCHPPEVWWINTYGNIVSDFLIFLIPIPIIFNMAVPLRQKITLYFVFLVGFFVCIVSILRAIYLRRFSISWDPSWDNAITSEWTCVELNTAIVCACLTTLKPFASRFFPRLLSSRRNHRGTATAFPDNDQAHRHPPTIGSKPVRLAPPGGGRRGFGTFSTDTTATSATSTTMGGSEGDDVSLQELDLEAQTTASKQRQQGGGGGERDFFPEPPPPAYVRSADAFSSASTDRISNLGPEARPAGSLEDDDRR